MFRAVLVGVLATATLAVPTASAAPRALTELQADAALHYGYSLQDLDYLNRLDTKVGQAEAEVAGLIAARADPAAIAAARARADSALFEYQMEERGHPLLVEDCLGLGKSVRLGLSDGFTRFRCQMSAIGNGGYIRETEVFTATDLRQLAAVPRPKGSKSAWTERLMADRLVSHARLVDPTTVDLARQDVRAAEEELVGLRALGASQRSLDVAAARVREAKRSLASALAGVKLRSAFCLGVGQPRSSGARPTFVSFRCRVTARVPSSILRAFMVAEVRSSSRLEVRRIEPLASLT